MILFENYLSLTCWKLRPQALAKSPAVVHPKDSNLGSRWVKERAASRRRKAALESDGWSSSTVIFGEGFWGEARPEKKPSESEA